MQKFTSFFGNNITVSHVNVQGLLSKLNLLELFLIKENIDIVCISEHWLVNNDLDFMYFENYGIITYFSRSNHIHGGSMIMAKNCINTNPLNSIKLLSVECNIELCGISCQFNNKKYIIITVYRPPNGDLKIFFTNITLALNIAITKADHIILCGDINIDSSKGSTDTKILFDLFQSFELQSTTNEPTRVFTNVNGYTSSSTIDYLITNIPKSEYDCKLTDSNIADHLAHVLKFNISHIPNALNGNKKCIKKRDVCESNMQNLIYSLSLENWDCIYEYDLNEAFNQFINCINWHLDISCPVKSFKVCNNGTNDYKGWVTPDIIQAGTELKNLHWLSNNLNCQNTKLLYNNKKQLYKKNIKQAKINFYQNKIDHSNNKTKETWAIINTKLGRKNKIHNEIKLFSDNLVITDSSKLVDIFGSHFSVVVHNKLHSHFGQNISLPCTLPIMIPQTFFFSPVTEIDLINIFNKLKNKNCIGNDGLSFKLLKQIKDFILRPLKYLINYSIENGCFPNILKISHVVPLLKTGDPLDIENYRLITLVSSLSKIMERVIYDQLTVFIEKYKILTPCQHGFREGKSVESASIHLLDDIYTNIDKGNYVVVLQFDLSKAFDTLDINYIVSKLFNLGVRGNCLEWIHSYLLDRKIIVRIGTHFSNEYNVSLGVPQGSVLGPLLFILYVNDLPKHIKSGTVTMFADDSTITVTDSNVESLNNKITDVLDTFTAWCDRNKLILNTSKTTYVNFYNRKPCPLLNFNFSNQSKFLGVVLDADLSWRSQIDIVCKKLNQAYFAIIQLKNVCDNTGLLNIYYSLAYSHISFSIMCWGLATERDRVFICQKKLIRLIFGLKPGESCFKIFKSNKLLTTPSIYIYKCLCFVKRNLHLFKTTSSYHNYSTRRNDLVLPLHNSMLYEKSPSYSCIKLYNSLPEELKNSQNFNSFKSKIKKILVEGTFYSVEAFLNR